MSRNYDDVICIKELLPTFLELCKLTEKEPEARYIFQLAAENLNQICSKNVSVQLSKLKECYFLMNSLVDKMWEKINTGHFSQVAINVRKIYSGASFYEILEDCREILDKAILVGCTENLGKDSGAFIVHLTSYLDKLQTPEELNLPIIMPFKCEHTTCDIPILECPSLDTFKTYFDSLQPVLLRNTINHWPALEKWRDLNYILKIAGNRVVPVEIGSNYASSDWSQNLIKIKDFLKRQFAYEENQIEYLAQHELFDQIPQLKDDIRIPDYCCLKNDQSSDVDIKAWLGPSGTLSPLHQDAKHNILCQIFGAKKIILASCDDTKFLYPHDNNLLNNTSQLNAENIDFKMFPLARNVSFMHLTLQEGECLYIPPKWWHFVKSLSKSFSVSFWWE